MDVWSEERIGLDGRAYGLRYLLTDEEVRGLQAAGLIGPVQRVVGMGPLVERTMAQFERDDAILSGGRLQ